MKKRFTAVVARAGVPDRNGNVFTQEAIDMMAAQNASSMFTMAGGSTLHDIAGTIEGLESKDGKLKADVKLIPTPQGKVVMKIPFAEFGVEGRVIKDRYDWVDPWWRRWLNWFLRRESKKVRVIEKADIMSVGLLCRRPKG